MENVKLKHPLKHYLVSSKKVNRLATLKLILVLIFIIVTSFKNNWNLNLLFSSLFEYAIIYLLIQVFPVGWKKISYAVSSILSFFFLINLGVFAFSGSYVTYIMWNNLANWSALGASLPLYLAAILGALVLSLLPMVRLGFNRTGRLAAAGASVLLYLMMFFAQAQSPFLGWKDFVGEYYQVQQQTAALKKVGASKAKIYKQFERNSITSGIDTQLKNPNVIVIFTEGFSSEIMDVNNDFNYNLTPNLDSFSKQTLNFTNYFNQTAATYRGVRGQLFSSQQYSEGYENGIGAVKNMTTTNLVSLQGILGSQGYNTEFINAEPEQKVWTAYVDNLGFEKVTSGSSKNWSQSMGEKILTDQTNYDLLFSQASTLNKSGKPFMLADYTYQTHVGENTSLKYENGSNAYLNKYYNLDNAFGKFWTKFKASPLSKNTIVVFTADHATFPDPTYNATFHTTRNYFVSPVPLMIYYPGVQPKNIDVNGKNSLSLTPTILDLMGQENHPNYFLGNSLFVKQTSDLQYVTAIANQMYSTKNLTEKETQANKNIKLNNSKIADELQEYYKISLNY